MIPPAVFKKLHDATLLNVAFDWTRGSCVAEFAGAPALPSPFRIAWAAVSDLHIPRLLAWGPSVSVLEIAEPSPGHYELHLQSGDVISLRAADAQFESSGKV
jgi:hypothetical protein